MKKIKRDYAGILDVFISGIIFFALLEITYLYGITTSFFQFEDYNVWTKLINIGMFWIIGLFCIDKFFEGIEKLKRRLSK